MSVNSLLEIQRVTKKYQNPQTRTYFNSLDQVSLKIFPNEVVGLVGESGCGKTTLLKVISGLEKADQGQVNYAGRAVDRLIKQDRLSYYKNVQLIYQNPYDVFDKRYKIRDILLQPLRIHGIMSSRSQRLEYIVDHLEASGFEQASSYLDYYPQELSGGQLQRISILRSLLLNPQLLLADEPVSMLDVAIRADILDLLTQSTQSQRQSLLIVSHDILPLLTLVNRLVVMRRGKIVEIVETHNFAQDVLHPYTKLLLANAYGEEVGQQDVQDWNENLQNQLVDAPEDELVEISRKHWVRFKTINY